ncbi:MAG TPA: hypothetical protein DCZ94_05625 [Lentisphaeria bacterium]|nr:MAG: hypothetical protein A2X48_07145 [Lentisphaerae bacterium GWF2_49_21]HBC86415.1 hypothetical protein [Lentisphaeria bacterium]
MNSTKIISKDGLQTSILVVDDEYGTRMLLDVFLSKEFNVSMASSGNEAISMLEKEKFDIVLSDVNMPEMSGKEFFGVCRKKYPEMQFILMTGKPAFADAINAVKDGAFYYLLKPLDLKLLNSLILKAVKEKESGSRPESHDAGIIKNLGAQYRIVRSLGSGVSGVVLLVESKGELYAMKLLRCCNEDDNYLNKMERFTREAEILMRIKNEHVVRIIEHNLSKTDENPYIIMEYVKGMSLSECIRENKLDIHQKISIILQIAETLDCVHGQGVLHRDIKPDNILVTDDLFVKMTDFGICYVPESSLTMTEQVLGSPAYMAPESFEAGRKPDLKSDIFSLGVLSYELFTGIRPFEEDTIYRVVNALRTRKPVSPVKLNPEIPMWMEDVMAKMLDKHPDRRFGSCGEISKAITHYLSGGGKEKMSFTTRIFRSMIPCDTVWS